ncbi:MAG: DUF3429 domain-containing protein [Proteobacteria bacterium]|nr:DUF3429 domain-containing protein [Pseudomonadota bacterium]
MTAFPLAGVPSAARWLGLAGLVPFYGAVAVLWAGKGDGAALSALLSYSAVILSFLGAVHWGRALASPELQDWPVLGWSVAPALIGWLAAEWMEATPAILLLIVAFWASFVVDRRAVADGRFPRWYLALRKLLSALVVLALGLSLLAVWA